MPGFRFGAASGDTPPDPGFERGKLPDFLIIGAQKAGTTSFYDLLCQHPTIKRAERKEAHFFDRDFQKGEEEYRSLFPPPCAENGREILTGEATPYYLFHPLVPERAVRVVPRAKLIALLRNPIDRAYSHYHHEVRIGREKLTTFEEALEVEEERLAGEQRRLLEDEHYASFAHVNFSYLSRGLYADQILRWREHFGQDALLVLSSEGFFRHPLRSLRRAQRHLKLPLGTFPVGKGDRPRRKRNKGSYSPMSSETRQRLREYFEPHNQKLYELLGVDYGWQ